MTKISKKRSLVEEKFYWHQVWAQFKTGDKSAFEEIYREYVNRLYNFGLKLTHDKYLVKDAIQDLFIDLFRYNINIQRPESLEFYLFKSLKRIIIKKLTRKNKLEQIDFRSFNLEIDFEKKYIENEQDIQKLKLLEVSLNQLNKKNRELIFYKFNSDLTNEEIGRIMGVKADTIRKQISRIIDGIREDFKHKVPDLFVMCFIA